VLKVGTNKFMSIGTSAGNLVCKAFTINNDYSVTAGNAESLAVANIQNDAAKVSAVLVDTNKVIVTYSTSGPNTSAVVVSLSGNSVSYGSPTSVLGDSVNYHSIGVLTSTKALFLYYGGVGVQAHVLSVSGTSLSASGATVVDNTATDAGTYVLPLATDKVLIGYVGNGSADAVARVVTVSGTTPAPQTVNVVDTDPAATINTAVLIGTDKALLMCGASGTLDLYVLTVSGNTVNAGSAAAFNEANVDRLLPNGTDGAIALKNSATGQLKKLTVSGTTPNASAPFNPVAYASGVLHNVCADVSGKFIAISNSNSIEDRALFVSPML
jgi:hypothetical protein